MRWEYGDGDHGTKDRQDQRQKEEGEEVGKTVPKVLVWMVVGDDNDGGGCCSHHNG